MINAFKMQRSLATLTFLTQFQRNLIHVQRSNNVVESTDSEDKVTEYGYDTLEKNSKVANTGANTIYMEAKDKARLYKKIMTRIS